VHLVPFGEYVPFESILKNLGIETWWKCPVVFASATRSLLTLPSGIKLYPLICYEIIFPSEMTDDIYKSDAILNVTNDAWFGDTPAPISTCNRRVYEPLNTDSH